MIIWPDRTIVYPKVQKELGITVSEYRVLDFLSRVSGDPDDPFFRVREVSREATVYWLGLSRTTITRIIRRLVKKKLLRRDMLAVHKGMQPTRGWYKIIQPYREEEEHEQEKESQA
ncbi:hypothetical protein ES702_05566 [subsurface metagenome]